MVFMNQFNTYTSHLNLDFLRDYCMEKGKRMVFVKNQFVERVGQPSRWLGYVTKGYFKYVVTNDVDGKTYNTGFSFEGEFVADYPNCLYHQEAEVSIIAGAACEVWMMDGVELNRMYQESQDMLRVGMEISESLFCQTYSRFLDFYRTDAQSRYERLMGRCPQIVQQIDLKDIASFLRVTPVTISKIRRKITFGE